MSAGHSVAAEQSGDGIAWRKPDVDAAFTEAKQRDVPLFLYWGAAWCPPCNQVKATIFNRQEFIERTRHVVPVYLDGDTPNAQRLAERFHVSGYPTMILMTASGQEIIRMPGEVDAQRYDELLDMAMRGGKPAKQALADALAHKASAGDWRALAWYAWDTDENQLVQKTDQPSTLKALASACPAELAEVKSRLKLLAALSQLPASNAAETPHGEGLQSVGANVADAVASASARPLVLKANFDLLTDNMKSIVPALPEAVRRARTEQLLAALNPSLTDPSLSETDRLAAWDARIALESAGNQAIEPAERQRVRGAVERADHDTTNAYERQSVVSAAAELLSDAGLNEESDALLKAELSRSHSPYYFMTELAQNAKRRGDRKGALEWSQKAWAASRGAATRLQWGTAYARMLIELAPQDETAIVATAHAVVTEAGESGDAMYQRNGRGLHRLLEAVKNWDRDGAHRTAREAVERDILSLCQPTGQGTAQQSEQCRKNLAA